MDDFLHGLHIGRPPRIRLYLALQKKLLKAQNIPRETREKSCKRKLQRAVENAGPNDAHLLPNNVHVFLRRFLDCRTQQGLINS